MYLLSIIILSYNTVESTSHCLESIVKKYKQELKDKQIEIILVDNASKDNTVEYIKKHFGYLDNLRIICNKQNFGFSKGNNIGAKRAEGEYLIFVNSDIEVLDDGFMKMLDFLKNHPEIGIIGGKLKNIDGSIQFSAGKFYNLNNALLMLMGVERLGYLRLCPKEETYVDWISGACLMIKKKLFERLGGFDENLFMYMEDMELCFRVKKDGYRICFYPKTEILHKEQGSSNRTFAVVNIYAGLLYFYKKHKNRTQYLFIKTVLTLKSLILIIFGTIIRNTYLSKTYKDTLNFKL